MINIALSTALSSPIHILYTIAECEHNNLIVISNHIIHLTDWGLPLDEDIFIQVEKKTVIHLLWLSIIDKDMYSFILPLEDLAVNDNDNLLIGCSNNGNVCIWKYKKCSSVIIYYAKVKFIEDNLASLLRTNETITFADNERYSLEEMCEVFKIELSKEINLAEINKGTFDDWMKQFIYRYQVIFAHRAEKKWIRFDEEKDKVIPKFEYIEESLYDGTHDKLHDGGLLKYHEAGKPKKLALKWSIKNSEYTAYFWFEEERIRDVFDRFYGAHFDTKTDFIVRIDPEKRKYELALYRYGLKEPYTIPEDAYQILVFKNKFEDYRSDNYNQERGAWVW